MYAGVFFFLHPVLCIVITWKHPAEKFAEVVRCKGIESSQTWWVLSIKHAIRHTCVNANAFCELMSSADIESVFFKLVSANYTFSLVVIVRQPESGFFASPFKGNICIGTVAFLKCIKKVIWLRKISC